jgi:hypothetical protein
MKAEIKEQLLKLTLQDIVELVQEKKMMESKAVNPNNRRTFYRTLVNIKEDIQIGEFGLIHRGPS